MKILSRLVLIGGLLTVGLRVPAQEAGEVEQLRTQLQEMKASFERAQQLQREQIEALQKQLDAVQRQQVGGGTSNIEHQTSNIELAAGQGIATNLQPSTFNLHPFPKKGGAYMDISLGGLFAVGGSTADDIEGGTQLGGHDPNQRGFTVQNVELTLSGAVDPYLRGQANVVLQIDSAGESFLELEETFMETASLPGNLQVKAGQYFTEFGRLNPQHPHSWAFVDQPLVNGRFLGPDGMRNAGARLSWLVPTPFYSELFFGVQNSQGGTAHSFRSDHGGEAFLGRLADGQGVKGFSDMLYSARYAASFEPTENQTLLGGVSAVFGPNSSDGNSDTQIYGTDVYWKWKSPRAHGGFPFVSWQTEALLRRYEAGASTSVDLTGDSVPDFVPRETVTDWGAYSQVLWGFKPGWVAGLRGDFVAGENADYERLYGADVSRASRWRISPSLTWYPSEFSKIRLQYNYDDRDIIGVDHSVWLQFEFLLGAHAAHKF